MIWFTSDTHFGHKNIIRHCKRPFDSVEEMNEALIDNWNSVVKPNDEVYHLGDFAFHSKEAEVRQYFDRLNGRISILFGNHDDCKAISAVAAWAGDVRTVKWEGHRFFLSHYAHRIWSKSHHGVYHLYGHSHGELPGVGRSMDVGVDAVGYYPISAEEVVAELSSEPFGIHHAN